MTILETALKPKEYGVARVYSNTAPGFIHGHISQYPEKNLFPRMRAR